MIIQKYNSSLIIEKMPQLLQFPFLPDNQVQYDPMKSAYGIAQKCRQCNKKILHHQSITTCDCYRYCHQRCLVLDLNKQNKQKAQQVLRCINCKKCLNVSYRMDIVTKPHINKYNIILMVLSLILISINIYAAVLFKYDVVKEVINACFIGFQASILAYAIINSFIVREFTAISVKSTHLGLIISAFLQLEKDLDQQMTNTELIR